MIPGGRRPTEDAEAAPPRAAAPLSGQSITELVEGISWEMGLPGSRRLWDLASEALERGMSLGDLDGMCSAARSIGLVELAVERGRPDWAAMACSRGWAPWESSPSRRWIAKALGAADPLMLDCALSSAGHGFEASLRAAAGLAWLGPREPWMPAAVEAMALRAAPGGEFERAGALAEAADWAAGAGPALRSHQGLEEEESALARLARFEAAGDPPSSRAEASEFGQDGDGRLPRCAARWRGWGEGAAAPWAKAISEALDRDAAEVLSCLLDGAARAGHAAPAIRSSLGAAGARRLMWTTLLGSCFVSWSWKCAEQLLARSAPLISAGELGSASARASALFECALGAVGREAGGSAPDGLPSQALRSGSLSLAGSLLAQGAPRDDARRWTSLALESAAARAQARWAESSIRHRALSMQGAATERALLSVEAWFEGSEGSEGSAGSKRL